MSFLSPDSKFMQVLTSVCDLVILNILFLVTCLPLFTIGAASAALNDMCIRMAANEEGGILRGYFRAFGRNFRQGTGIFLLLALFGGITCFNLFYFSAQRGMLYSLRYLSVLLLALTAMVWSYAFPLQSHFQNSVLGTLKNALLLSIAHLPRTLVLTVLQVLPFGLLYFQPDLFFRFGSMWLAIYFSASAYLSALVLRKVFASLIPETAETP